MVKLEVSIVCDNGYQCSCCRAEWTDVKIFEVEEDKIEEVLSEMDEHIRIEYECYHEGRHYVSGARLITREWTVSKGVVIESK